MIRKILIVKKTTKWRKILWDELRFSHTHWEQIDLSKYKNCDSKL